MEYSEGQINTYLPPKEPIISISNYGIQNGLHIGKKSLLEINNGITSALHVFMP